MVDYAQDAKKNTRAMKDLLERLKELDPETFDLIINRLSSLDWSITRASEGPALDHIAETEDYLFVVMGLIMKAIEKRRGKLILEYPVKYGEWWGAQVDLATTGRIRIGPSAIQALLEAYIAALEAEG